MPPPTRYLSGIKPTGDLHLGNYFGAIREHVRLQHAGESYSFIAAYPALTGLRDAAKILESRRLTAATALASGPAATEPVPFSQRGGLGRARELFGQDLDGLLVELIGIVAA